MKPISWMYTPEDILAMEDKCAACSNRDETNRGVGCRSCVIARALADNYYHELKSQGEDVTLEDAFGMLFE